MLTIRASSFSCSSQFIKKHNDKFCFDDVTRQVSLVAAGSSGASHSPQRSDSMDDCDTESAQSAQQRYMYIGARVAHHSYGS